MSQITFWGCCFVTLLAVTGCGNSVPVRPEVDDAGAAESAAIDERASAAPGLSGDTPPAPMTKEPDAETVSRADSVIAATSPESGDKQGSGTVNASDADMVKKSGEVVPALVDEPQQADGPPSDSDAEQSSLSAQVDAFEIPPKWLASVTSNWDVANKPWKDGRLEIRRLLGENNESARREALKLMWDYRLKDDMGNGHEYGMYTYLGQEPIWAVIAFRDELGHSDESFQYPPYFAAQGLASILATYGEFEEAEQVLKRSAKWVPPPPSGRFAKPNTGWVEVRQAESHDALGDLYLAWGKTDQALKHFRDAVRIFPTGKPPYGKHLLPRKAKKVQTKIDLIEGGSLDTATLKDGTYRANAIGYSGDVKLTVTVTGGRVAKIKIDHQEKIDQGATKTIPDRIIEKQSLVVDGVTGATVTKDAIISGMLEALRKAGL